MKSLGAGELAKEHAGAAHEARLATLVAPVTATETVVLEPEPEPRQMEEPLWLRLLRANGVPEADRFPNKEFWAGDSPLPGASPTCRLSFRGEEALEQIKHIPARPKVLIDEALEDSGLVGVGHARENDELFQASFLRLKAWAAGEAVRAEYKDRHGKPIRCILHSCLWRGSSPARSLIRQIRCTVWHWAQVHWRVCKSLGSNGGSVQWRQ
jgi:hypothetical protein